MFESRIETLKKVRWDGEDRAEFEFLGGCCWSGAKRKDFWNPDKKWEKVIKPGCKIRTWSVQFSTIVGFEVLEEDKFVPVWCVTNDFQTKKDRKKSSDEYCNFIRSEGDLIAALIDEGKTLKGIDAKISDGHSGNTYACALGIGIRKAKNKQNADKIRKAHNKAWGVTEGKGLVNPAVLTISSK